MATEKQIERGVMQVLALVGCEFMSFSQPRNTMQTYGIPDLKVYHVLKGVTFWFEVKRPEGVQSKYQQMIEQMVTACGERYFIGGTIEAIEAANEMLGTDIGVPPGERWKGKKLK